MNRLALAMLLVLVCLTAPSLAAALPTGSLDPGFGDQGFVRLYFDDRLGATTDDRAKSIQVLRGDLGGGAYGPKWILVAGQAGRHVAITRLTMNGQIDPTFGANGVAFSARTNVASFGGMVVMPNGDIVIGYADDYTGPDSDSRDFFIEVFAANGQPKNIGGDESPNQRGVDLSSSAPVLNGRCSDYYRENRAQRLILTAEAGIVLVGDIAVYNVDGNFVRRDIATAEFNGGTYLPARPSLACTGAGGRLDAMRYPPAHDNFNGDGVIHAAVSDVGAHVLYAGSVDPVSDAEAAQLGLMNYRDLAIGYAYDDAYNLGMPEGYWRQRQSDFWQIRTDNQPGSFVLFGDAENGTLAGAVRRQPIIATVRANALQPLWFYPVGGAAEAMVAGLEGWRLPGARDLMLLGAAKPCSANGCSGEWDSFAVGVSNGATVLNAYQPQPAFGNQGWVRHRVRDYDGSPAANAIAWTGALQGNLFGSGDTDLYVAGEFRTSADNHLDMFVARIRVANAGDPPWVIPADVIFRDGFQ